MWTGSVFNPGDGKTYSGKITLKGDRLITAGCVSGGLICRSVRLDPRAVTAGYRWEKDSNV